MRKVASSFLFLFVFFVPVFSSNSWSTELVRVPTAWLDEHETFLIWYAKEQGWDHEVGLDLELNFFDTGNSMLEALSTEEWVFGATGVVPSLLSYLKYGVLCVGIANDASMSTGVLVHPDSTIVAGIKGWNNDYPDVFGTPDTVKGKVFVVPTTSAAHYALYVWLRVLGLREQDVVIKNMRPHLAQEAFRKHLANGVSLWSPDLFLNMKDNVLVANILNCGKRHPIVFVAEPNYARDNPEVIVKILGLYLRVVDLLQKTDPADLIYDYIRFFREWADKIITEEVALIDLQNHPVYNLQQQLNFFATGFNKGQIYQWLGDIVEFLNATGRVTPAEYTQLKNVKTYAVDTYLKLLEQSLKQDGQNN